MSLATELRQLVSKHACVPKPQSTKRYRLVGIGRSRGQEAVVYELPKRSGSQKASEKRIALSVFDQAVQQLSSSGVLSRKWFRDQYPELEADGTCNFTTLGGVLELLGLARYTGPGEYSSSTRKRKP